MRKLMLLAVVVGLCAAGLAAFAQEQDKPEGEAEKAAPEPAKKALEAPEEKVLEPAGEKTEKESETDKPRVGRGVVILKGLEDTEVIELPALSLWQKGVTVELRDGKILVNGKEVGEAVKDKALTVTVKDGKIYVNGREVGKLPERFKLRELPGVVLPVPEPGELKRRILRRIPGAYQEKLEKLRKREGEWRPVLPFGERAEGFLGKPGLESILRQLKAIRSQLDRAIEEVERLMDSSKGELRVLPRIEKELRRIVPELLREREEDEKKDEEEEEGESLREGILRRLEKLIERKLEGLKPDREGGDENK